MSKKIPFENNKQKKTKKQKKQVDIKQKKGAIFFWKKCNKMSRNRANKRHQKQTSSL